MNCSKMTITEFPLYSDDQIHSKLDVLKQKNETNELLDRLSHVLQIANAATISLCFALNKSIKYLIFQQIYSAGSLRGSVP